MITLLLIKKIVSLFLCIIAGFVIVRCGVMKPEHSKPMSTFLVYIVVPCSILSAFQIDYTPEILRGFLIACLAAVLVHIIWIVMDIPLKRVLHMDGVERMSILYSNSGNLVMPIVAAIFGAEWVIYSSAFMLVQLVFMWSHGKAVICGETQIDIKKIVTNINLIAAAIGIVLFIFHISFPAPLQDAVDSFAAMIGPIAMFTSGLLIGGMDLKQVFSYRRAIPVTFLRLIVFPAVILVLWKFGPMASWMDNGEKIMLISLLGCLGPSASMCTQMAIIYDRDAGYASAINVISTLLCIITMPLMVAIFQL